MPTDRSLSASSNIATKMPARFLWITAACLLVEASAFDISEAERTLPPLPLLETKLVVCAEEYELPVRRVSTNSELGFD